MYTLKTLFLICTILLFSFNVHASQVNIQQAEEDLGFALGVEAYIWGYPLVITAATTLVVTDTDKPLPNAHAPVNAFGHVTKLFTAKDTDVVSSNVDTVYSSAFVDLKQGAALVSVPDTGDRYYSLMLEDAYTNVFGYIGSRATGNKAGQYLITAPGWEGKQPQGVDKVIESPTPLVWIIGRTLVDGQSDLPNVHAVQEGYKLEMVPPVMDTVAMKKRWDLGEPGSVPAKMADELDWKVYFYWVGQLMKDNPPPKADSAFYSQFVAIGLSVENGFDTKGLSEATLKGLAKGYEAGKQIVKREALKTGGEVVNGWAYNMAQGEWGQDFNLRAAIANRSLGMNNIKEALYFNTRTTGTGEKLNGNNSYTITFKKGEHPPVDAFWSMTMYNANNFFVENEINRYAIGNRTEGLKTNDDGSLTIYVQKHAPEGEKKANWLPAPDGEFRLSLRLYVPKKQALDGAWAPASVMRVK